METKEENFTISNYPLEQTEFLYGQKQGKVSSIKLFRAPFRVQLYGQE